MPVNECKQSRLMNNRPNLDRSFLSRLMYIFTDASMIKTVKLEVNRIKLSILFELNFKYSFVFIKIF